MYHYQFDKQFLLELNFNDVVVKKHIHYNSYIVFSQKKSKAVGELNNIETNNFKNKSSYRGIFKATSLFGGVKVYEILIEIIKSKFIAILLGPTGIGIQGLYTSATQMIQQITSFGLSQSAVRNVAESYGYGDKLAIGKTVTALRKLVWITGLLGMIMVIAFSPLLSKTSFGDNLHILGFIAISITLLLYQLTAGQKVILQGTRQYKYLAKCTAYGVTIGLIVSVPLYYYWGVKAIVPNIIITAITAFLLSWLYSRKISFEKVTLSIKETISIGRSMLIMGIAMSFTHFFSLASSYVLRSCIRLWGGVEEVGLYTAGFLLMTQYTGLVFQAMSTDFYPRLAAINKDNAKCKEIMNQQGEVGLLLLGPLMVLCVVFIPLVIRVLYSKAFLAVNDYVVWCAIGVIFQMASWSISYVFIAKAESKLFLINEITVGIYGLGLNLLGYYWGGLKGIGISFAVKYLLYLIQVYIIAHKRYFFSFTRSFFKVFILQLSFVICVVIMAIFIKSNIRYVIGSVICIITLVLSLFELNKRMDIVVLLKERFHKK